MASVEGLAVALLAAGRSTRFGNANKLMAPLGGKPLIEWAARAGREINAAHYFVVVGPEVLQHESPDGYVRLVNPDAGEGLASSLRMAACQARETGASALLILLGDMPLISPGHLVALLTAFAANPLRAAFSRVPGGAPQPPAVFPATLFSALETLNGDSGARGLTDGAAFVEASADLLIDVDTPDDLQRCARLIDG